MNVSRGGFLKLCGAAALGWHVDASPLLGVAAGPFAAAEAGAPLERLRLQHARAALFRPHLNTTFTVRTPEGTHRRLVLARVIEQPISNQVEQFSLIFHGTPGLAVLDGTHAFLHPALGDFDLFIAPVGGSNAQRTVYEACFSRHVSRGEDEKACPINS